MNYYIVLLYIIFTVIYLQLEIANALVCFQCKGSSRNGDKDGKECVFGYSTMNRQKCPKHHVCSTYQYEVSILGLIKSKVTMRGCQPRDLVANCDVLLSEIRALVKPARVHELECKSCRSDLCNLR